MIYLEDEDEEIITNMLLKRKDAKISELQANIGRAKNVINYLELENKKLETKKAISEVRAIKARKEARKANALLDETLRNFDDSENEEEHLPRQRPRTIGLKKALVREREKEAELVEKNTPSELLAIEICKDRESCLERENLH